MLRLLLLMVWQFLVVGATAVPLGLPPTKTASDPAEMIELGRVLFFDARLSANGKISCASCHQPKFGFADPQPVSIGVHGSGSRNSPSLLNRVYFRRQFWDGRADTLEQQAEGPLFSAQEMANTREALVGALKQAKDIEPLWRAAFRDQPISVERIIQAITAYERSLLSGDSDFDRFQAGQISALSDDAIKGKELFFGKANCSLCHSGFLFSNQDFVNVGAGKPNDQDPGRYAATMQGRDWKMFRVPSLRDVALTAPYMHDGSLARLEDVIDLYDRGGAISETKDYRVRPLRLTDQEKSQLIEFLKALTGKSVRTLD
jgi:cytochrome c peroxidase